MANKCSKKRAEKEPAIHNPVAKYAHRTNRCHAFRDRTQYRRQPKHKNREPFPITAIVRSNRKGFSGFLVILIEKRLEMTRMALT
jgi:hypothetical protein